MSLYNNADVQRIAERLLNLEARVAVLETENDRLRREANGSIAHDNLVLDAMLTLRQNVEAHDCDAVDGALDNVRASLRTEEERHTCGQLPAQEDR